MEDIPPQKKKKTASTSASITSLKIFDIVIEG